jgi:two-component system, OmpR family, sensor histidine kinase SenX3
MRRRKSTVFFLVLGICLVVLAVALNVGWILLNLEKVALLVFGIIFFAMIITGLTLNTTFLLREIKRNEQQDAFLNAMTHELKTPIASIRLYLETLQTRNVDEAKRQEFYGTMLKDSDRLLNTVEQVLQASRTKESNRRLNLSDVSARELIADCVQQIRNRYNLSSGAIQFVDFENNLKIYGDATELAIVFSNLLDNAVKYSGEKVEIVIKGKILNEKRVEIRIEDSGVGLAKNELKRVFRRFYRIPSKTKGTGLGLAIVQSIVKKHGGKIFAESKGDSLGSVFVVQLPLAK